MTSVPTRTEAPAGTGVVKHQKRFATITGLLAISVSLVSSLAIANSSARPFSANFTGTREANSITFTGTGIATHLGRFDLDGYREFEGQPTPSNPCVYVKVLVLTLTAANGDELWLDATGGELCFDLSSFPVSVPFLAEAEFVGVGGTGRFTDATGDFQMFWSGEALTATPSFTGELWGFVGY
jgi:hypothetical protein